MRRVAGLGLLALVAFIGSCTDSKRSGGVFGIPDGTLGEIRILIGTPPSCSGGTNDGEVCDPHVDCPGTPDAFCVAPSYCHGDLGNGNACTTVADCVDTKPTCTAGKCSGDIDNGKPCLVATDCTDIIPTCDKQCDRGGSGGNPCSFDSDCPGGGTCTSGLIHAYQGRFTYDGDAFSQDFPANDTDGDHDGFTPANFIDTAPLGVMGHLQIKFPDGVADCVRVTWGAQRRDVLPLTCGVGANGDGTRTQLDFEIRP